MAATVAAIENEPKGFGKAEFRMSPEQVAKLYEGQIRTLEGLESLGATPLGGPYVVRQALSGQRVEGLAEPTTVELRYWKDQLWVIIVYYGENSADSVKEMLTKKHGPGAQGIRWRSERVQVNAVDKERWYSLADAELSAEVQKLFAEEMRQLQQRGPQGGAPPAATPAP